MVATSKSTPVRELMPDLFIPTILERVKAATGKAPHKATISDAVANERYTSKYWPYIEALALETNPELYRERMAYLHEQAGDKAA